MLWWCNMKKIVLFSNCKEIFEATSKVVNPKHKLIWCSFTSLEENKYPRSDIVIIHFDHNRLKEDTFKFIIKVKGRLGHKTPILALIEGRNCTGYFFHIESRGIRLFGNNREFTGIQKKDRRYCFMGLVFKKI